jgi:hypothetical protein
MDKGRFGQQALIGMVFLISIRVITLLKIKESADYLLMKSGSSCFQYLKHIPTTT